MVLQRLTPFMRERLTHFKKTIPMSMTFFIYLFGWGLITPIFNIRINEVSGSLFLSGIIFALLGFGGIFFNPAFGIMCDRINPKKLLQASLLAYTGVFLLYSIANNYELLFIARFLHAVACSAIWVSGWTIVRRLTVGRYAQEELSSWSTVQNIAYFIAPIIGGFLITIYSWPIVYYLASLSSFIGYLYVTFKVKFPEFKPDGTVKRFRDEWRSFFKEKSSSIRLVLLTLILFTVSTAFASFFPLQLVDNNMSIEGISVILAVSPTIPYIAFPIIIGFLSDKYGRRIPTLIGLILMAFGLIAFAYVTSFTQFLLYAFIIYTGIVFIDMCTNAELNDILPPGEAGGFTGIFETVKNTGMMIGPLIIGFVSQASSIPSSFLLLAVLSLASIIILKGFKNY